MNVDKRDVLMQAWGMVVFIITYVFAEVFIGSANAIAVALAQFVGYLILAVWYHYQDRKEKVKREQSAASKTEDARRRVRYCFKELQTTRNQIDKEMLP